MMQGSTEKRGQADGISSWLFAIFSGSSRLFLSRNGTCSREWQVRVEKALELPFHRVRRVCFT
jgi:hypothetical protein